MNNSVILYSKYSNNCKTLLGIMKKNSNLSEISNTKLICVDNKNIRDIIKNYNIDILPVLIIDNSIVKGSKVIIFINNVVDKHNNEKNKLVLEQNEYKQKIYS